jgi:hypothetical protein
MGQKLGIVNLNLGQVKIPSLESSDRMMINETRV